MVALSHGPHKRLEKFANILYNNLTFCLFLLEMATGPQDSYGKGCPLPSRGRCFIDDDLEMFSIIPLSQKLFLFLKRVHLEWKHAPDNFPLILLHRTAYLIYYCMAIVVENQWQTTKQEFVNERYIGFIKYSTMFFVILFQE